MKEPTQEKDIDVVCVKLKDKTNVRELKTSILDTIEICQSNKLGRYLLAARDIEVGEVILNEAPLIVGPSQITGPVCLNCLNSITADNSVECVTCGWPLCKKENCRNVVIDHIAECNWTIHRRKQKVKISQFITPHRTYECITTIRCLYQKEKNPTIWHKLQTLESHCINRQNTERYEADRSIIAQFLYRFFNISNTEFTENDILKICGIIQVNGHEVPLTDPPYVAIFEIASMLEHSCLPNCCKTFTSNGNLLTRAVRKINKGEHVTICYTDPLWNTINRREHLALTKYFYCECDRCNDVTELETYYSGYKCFDKECKGYIVPQMKMKHNFLPDPEWVCNSCSCLVPCNLINKELNRIAQDFTMTDKHDPKSCKLFLTHYTYRNLSLHQNHYFLTEIRLKLAQLYGQMSENNIQDLSDQDLLHKIELCHQVLLLCNTIFPAEWRIRGTLTFELHASIAEEARRNSIDCKMDVESVKSKLIESKKYLQESMFLLKYEPEVLPEGIMAKQATQNLADLENLLGEIDL